MDAIPTENVGAVTCLARRPERPSHYISSHGNLNRYLWTMRDFLDQDTGALAVRYYDAEWHTQCGWSRSALCWQRFSLIA